MGDGVLLGEDLVERARGNLRAQCVGKVVLHLADGILQRVEATVDARVRALVDVGIVHVILDGDVQLDGHVVGGLCVEGHVLVFGHEAHVVGDVDEGELHVKAGAGEAVELPQPLDHRDVLLTHDVARREHENRNNDDKYDHGHEELLCLSSVLGNLKRAYQD